MNKLYSVHDHWTNINKKNDVDIESIDGVITGIKVNGEDYSGGEWQNIFDNTITTVSAPDGFYTTNIGVVIEADSIRVTFDGVEYICPKRSISEISTNFYGALTPLESGEEDFDWSEFPFSIATVPDGVSMSVTTQTAGTHTLKIDIPQSGGGSSDFSTATLTVNGNFTPTDLFIAPVVEKDPNNEDIAFPMIQNGNSTNTVILYKGRSTLMYRGSRSRSITVSGNIETVDTGIYIITGDCTITIS